MNFVFDSYHIFGGEQREITPERQIMVPVYTKQLLWFKGVVRNLTIVMTLKVSRTFLEKQVVI